MPRLDSVAAPDTRRPAQASSGRPEAVGADTHGSHHGVDEPDCSGGLFAGIRASIYHYTMHGMVQRVFWSRLGKGRLGIGLLSDAAARAALVEPLTAHGVSIDADALDAAVEDSQCYPYFIQLWGEALWEQHLATGATRLTAAHAHAVRPDVAARVTDYYEDRYLELDQSGWLAVAACVAARYLSTPTLTYEERS